MVRSFDEVIAKDLEPLATAEGEDDVHHVPRSGRSLLYPPATASGTRNRRGRSVTAIVGYIGCDGSTSHPCKPLSEHQS
jgi:hypothetical protein